MSSVDERIVEMKIDNSKFLPGVKASQTALASLNKAVDAAGNSKGMQNLGNTVETVRTKFSLLNAAAVTVVGTITNKLVNSGINLVKAMTLDPIIAGFHSYEETINATKTIMANTGASAKTTGKYLKDLQQYANQTVYSFSDMAKNIGTFTAAGVKLPAATSAIKGIANLAALSGSNTQQASSAMYQLSQALAAGQVHLQDWNSVVNAGMGGKVFQTALARTAAQMGTLSSGAVKYSKDAKLASINGQSFRESIQSKPGQTSWLTSGVLTKTLEQFTGEMSVAQLRAEGFSKAQAKQIYAMGQTAKHSATDIKTFSQLQEALKEEVATAWGAVFKTIFGGLGNATKLFSAVHTAAENALTAPVYALNNILKVWDKLGGRSAVIQGVVNIWHALGSVFKAVGEAWKEAFPDSGKGIGSALASISKGFEDLTKHLIPSKAALADITDIFKAVFQVLGVAAHIVGGVYVGLFKLFGLFIDNGGGATTGILGIVGGIDRMISGFLDMTKLSSRIDAFFNKMADNRAKILVPIIKTVGDILKAFDPLMHGDFSGFTDGIKSALGNLAPLGDIVSGIGDKFTDLANKLINMGHGGTGFVGTLVQDLRAAGGYLQDFGKKLSIVFGAIGNAGALGGAGFKSVANLSSDSQKAATAGDKLKSAWDGFINAMKWIGNAMAPVVKTVGAGINEIWNYISNLFGGMNKMSFLQVVQLIFSGAALLYVKKFMDSFSGALDGFKEIGEKSGKVLDGITGNLKTMQQGVKAKIILEIAAAVGILAASLWVISKIPAKQLAISMGAMATMMGGLVGAMAVLTKAGGKWGALKLPTLAASLILMATALSVMAGAVALFGNMKWSTLAKGFAGVTAALALLGGAATGLAILGPSIIAGAGAMLILSVAMSTMVGTIVLFSKIKWGTLLSGLAKMTTSMLILATGMAALGEISPMILAASVAMGILSVTMTMMLGTLMAYSKVSWGTLLGGIAKLVVALAGLAIAGLMAPGITALGIALGILGGAMMLIGGGVALLGVGLATLAASGMAGLAVLTAGIQAFLLVLPSLGLQFIAAMTTILEGLAKEAPQIVASLVVIGEQLLKGLVELLPSVVQFVDQLIVALLQVITDNAPKLISAGVTLLENLITGLGQAAGSLTDAIGRTILQLLTALDAAINKYEGPILQMGVKITVDLIKGLLQGLGSAASALGDGIRNLANSVINWFKGVLGIHSPSTVFAGFGKNIVQGLINGITSLIGKLVSTAGNLANRLISTVVGFLRGLPGKAVNAISSLGGMLAGKLSSAFSTAVSAVSRGVSNIASGIGQLPGKISGLIGRVGDAAKNLGHSIIDGIGRGVGAAADWASNIGHDIESAINSAMGLPRQIGGWSLKVHGVGVTLPTITVPGFAKGTDYFGGGMAMVGEAGPELVSMPGGSSVITNKNLKGFMAAVNALAAKLTTTRQNGTNSEGSIVYKVSAAMQGDPKTNGVKFAADLIAGLRNGLAAGQTSVNKSTSDVGTGLTDSFAKVLGIHSPSRVFHELGLNVGKGFVNGITASINAVIAAGKAMAKNAVDAVTKTTTDAQVKADAQSARAQGLRDAAADLRAKARNKKLSKDQKAQLNKQANELTKQAKAAQKQADASQGAINRQNAQAAAANKFNSADAQGKADILNQRATSQAEAAEKDRKKALELSIEADKIRKTDAKKAAELDKQAKAALADANAAATAAKQNANQANQYAAEALIGKDGKGGAIADVQKQIDADKAAVELQAKLDGMTDSEKADYYKQQAADSQATADAKYADAEAKLAKAKNEAKTNAKQAQKDVAAAQQDVADAEAAKQAADDATQQAQQYADSATQSADTATSSNDDLIAALKMPDMSIASSAVFGAQNMFDAYTKALAATTKAASADQAPTIQFVQNNTSPVALNPSEVYRQSKNLLSGAERKLAGALTP